MRIEIKIKKQNFESYVKELVLKDMPAGYIKLTLKKYIENPKSYNCMAGVIRFNISDEWIIADILDKYDIRYSTPFSDGFMKELPVGMNEEVFWEVIREIKKISPNKKIVIY